MSEKPIIMTAHSVRAILAGRKTQTRRVLKPQPRWSDGGSIRDAAGGQMDYVEPHWQVEPIIKYAVGDQLWVKEAFAMDGPVVRYAATDDIHEIRAKKSPLFMPRWASRITLEVTGVKAERLQDISEDDAKAEAPPEPTARKTAHEIAQSRTSNIGNGYRDDFMCVWSKIHGAGAWAANPWVAAISFRVVKS